jgi:hypothetical protein
MTTNSVTETKMPPAHGDTEPEQSRNEQYLTVRLSRFSQTSGALEALTLSNVTP